VLSECTLVIQTIRDKRFGRSFNFRVTVDIDESLFDYNFVSDVKPIFVLIVTQIG